MSVLYWCCSEGDPNTLLDLLAARGWTGRFEGLGNRQPIITIFGPDPAILRETILLLARKRLRSAALVELPLRQNELYVAAEWWDRFVVEEGEFARAEFLGEWLVPVGQHAPRHLLIFKTREPQEADTLDDPPDARPIARSAHVAAVIANPSAYYGELADPRIGGANALFAGGWEAARECGLSEAQVLVGVPETFGFEVDRSESSVVAWRRRRMIEIEAVGFSLGSWEEPLRLLEAHSLDVDMEKLLIHEHEWRNEGLGFGLAVLLKGLADPPIIIPTGSVYQQPLMGAHVQNLASARPASVTVAAGATVPLVLPAYCLNPTFSPPHGPVEPTLLVASSVSGPQQSVWEGIRRRYRGQS
jgi:hypothetical protein